MNPMLHFAYRQRQRPNRDVVYEKRWGIVLTDCCRGTKWRHILSNSDLKPIRDSEGVLRDPIPIDQMTPRQRARYVAMLREEAKGLPRPPDEGIPFP